MRTLREIQPGSIISAEAWNTLVREISRLQKISADAPLEIVESGGIKIRLAQNQWVVSVELTANTDNYPTNGARFFQFDNTGAYELTGLDGGTAGSIVYLTNIGTDSMTLKDNYSGSIAQNQFFFPNGDTTLATNQCIMLLYDTVAEKWRPATPVASAATGGEFVQISSLLSSGSLSGWYAGYVCTWNGSSWVNDIAKPVRIPSPAITGFFPGVNLHISGASEYAYSATLAGTVLDSGAAITYNVYSVNDHTKYGGPGGGPGYQDYIIRPDSYLGTAEWVQLSQYLDDAFNVSNDGAFIYRGPSGWVAYGSVPGDRAVQMFVTATNTWIPYDFAQAVQEQLGSPVTFGIPIKAAFANTWDVISPAGAFNGDYLAFDGTGVGAQWLPMGLYTAGNVTDWGGFGMDPGSIASALDRIAAVLHANGMTP